MKILYLITGLGGGGAEKIVCDLADQMILKDHEVKIAYLTGDIVVYPKHKEIELICLGLNSFFYVYKAIKNYQKLLKIFQPDVVHAHMVHANIFSRISRMFINIPKLICSAHSNNEGGRLRMLAYRLTNNLADITTNVSNNASMNFEKLKAIPNGKIKTVYNGIDLKKFEPFKKNQNNCLKEQLNINKASSLFIAIGRYHDAKDYPNLIHAFAQLKNTQKFNEKKPKLLIVGDGELRRNIEQLIEHLQLGDDIFLLGRRDDIPDLLNISDFFVLSSKYEGLPTVVMEAMACQTYVISTDCGGSAEIMGETGKLIPIQNSVALANAICEVLSLNDSFIRENNVIARKRVEDNFSLQASVNKWLELYAS